MIQHVFSALCQSASIDQLTGTLSVLGVIEKLNAEVPAPLPITTPPSGFPFPVTLLTIWFNSGSAEAISKERVKLTAPSGGVVASHETAFSVQQVSHHRRVIQFSNTPYVGDGVYWFELELEADGLWHNVARIPLIIETKVVSQNSQGS